MGLAHKKVCAIIVLQPCPKMETSLPTECQPERNPSDAHCLLLTEAAACYGVGVVFEAGCLELFWRREGGGCLELMVLVRGAPLSS